MHWRHEQLSLRMALAAATHHSAQARAKEGVEGETNDAPRRPMPPLPGTRPAPLEEVAEPHEKLGQHSGIGYELVHSLDVPVLQMVEQPVDASALALLEEEEEKDLAAEYMELVRSGFSKSPALLDRMKEVVQRREVLRQKGRGRKKKKRRKRKLPKCSSLRSLPARAVRTRKPGHLSCGSSWCSVSGCCLSSPGLLDFWEMASTMPLYFTLCLVRRWKHAHASVCWTFGRFLWFFYVLVSGSYLPVLVSPEEYKCADFLGDNLLVYSRIQLFLVRQWRHVHVILRRRGAFHGVSP